MGTDTGYGSVCVTNLTTEVFWDPQVPLDPQNPSGLMPKWQNMDYEENYL